MGNFNKVIISGNLGRDPVQEFMPDGRPVTKFSIACNEKYSTREGDVKENTMWVNVEAFDSKADVCYKYLKKGMHVLIEGKLSIRKYQGRDGSDKLAVSIRLFDVEFHGGPRPKQEGYEESNAGSGQSDKPAPSSDPGFGISDNDIPF